MNIGRYRAADPLSAARKGFNRYCRTDNIKKLCEFFITIKETIGGTPDNLFSYKAVAPYDKDRCYVSQNSTRI